MRGLYKYMSKDNKAIVLLSGGLDSITVLAHALDLGQSCLAVNFHYGQRHNYECGCAERISKHYGVELRTLRLPEGIFAGSSLVDARIEVAPADTPHPGHAVPQTYVPMRNSIFLTIAAAIAEAENASKIYIGANHLDYSGYPDCHPEYLKAMEKALNLGCAKALEGKPTTIEAPLLQMHKSEIIKHGLGLGVDYAMTTSCYQCTENGTACGRCDACSLRLQAFAALELTDPISYAE